MSPFWKKQATVRPSGGILEDQSVHPEPEKSRLIVDRWYAEDEDEDEGYSEESDSRRGGFCAMLKKLLSIGGGKKWAEGSLLTVYIGKNLRRRQIPLDYLGYEGFRQLLRERRDGDALDWNSNLPIEIKSCTAQRFRETMRAAVAEEEIRRRYRL